jgi:4-alpha-glucanotransferase
MTALPVGRGLLLPVSALAGGHGVGDFGPAARRLVKTLSEAGYVAWQTLPLVPPGRGDSPYSTRAARCLATMAISLDDLAELGLLDHRAVARQPRPLGPVDFAAARAAKRPLLERAAEAFAAEAGERVRAALTPALRQAARFACNRRHHGTADWWTWHDIIEPTDPELLRFAALQVIAEQQWQRLRDCARGAGVTLFGDLPLYVDHASPDVWANPSQFQLDDAGQMAGQAGVPPDAFSASGQLWRMPLYRWPAIAEDEFTWWVERLAAARRHFDLIRLDHFRGLAAFWAVDGKDTDARRGTWQEGPGDALLMAIGTDGIVAEDLGVIDADVRQLRDRHKLPGMHVLQFAEPGAEDSPHHPQNHRADGVAYIGTHDNPTALSWWYGLGSSGRAARGQAFGWRRPDDLLTSLWSSPAALRVATAQDVLGLDDSTRTNRPGTGRGNWRWRLDRRSEAVLVERLVSSRPTS